MNTSVIIGALALVLAGLLATGHAFDQEAGSGITPTLSDEQLATPSSRG